jgi:hypothetical protein
MKRFEVLTALLEGNCGARVILIHTGKHDNADVVEIRENHVRAIQCKHRSSSAHLDADVIAEVIGTIDLHRVRYLRSPPSSVGLFPLIVSNGDSQPPREVKRTGPLLRKGFEMSDGSKTRMHFVGEHTCYAFVRHTEGALRSGLRVAQELARRDRIIC